MHNLVPNYLPRGGIPSFKTMSTTSVGSSTRGRRPLSLLLLKYALSNVVSGSCNGFSSDSGIV